MLQELQECIAALLRLDRAWLPDRPGHSMYIRPYMFSIDGALGVSRSNHTMLSVILSPVGPYFKSGEEMEGVLRHHIGLQCQRECGVAAAVIVEQLC